MRYSTHSKLKPHGTPSEYRYISPLGVITRTFHHMRYITLLALLILIASGCATTEEIRETEEPELEKVESSLDQTLLDDIDFDMYRSQLSDHYTNVDNEIPEVFKISESEREDTGESTGYRIQLISTNERQLADSLALKFDMWADTADVDRRPISYIQFRQPVFRVHVGDFKSRRIAIEYLGVIRRFFPGAWIVHDQIDTDSLID